MITRISSQTVVSDEATSGFIGRIPVRNLWLLMLYASDLFKTQELSAVGQEDAPDELPEILAEILVGAAEERMRRRLSIDYRSRSDRLRRVRGRINLLETERHQLLARGQVSCSFHELTINTPRNRFVQSALRFIANLVEKPDLASRCRRVANDMQSMGVIGAPPSMREMVNERFGHHDVDDQHMVAAARLAFEIAIPNEQIGSLVLPQPGRDEHKIRRLFENAVGGLYKVALPPDGWQVRTGSKWKWQTERQSSGIESILPTMKTDIVLDHPEQERRIIIDTKFTQLIKSAQYDGMTLDSGHIYQLYAYLHSQVGKGDKLADKAEGVLLHPSIGEAIDEHVFIQEHRFRFLTVDLTGTAMSIRREILRVVDAIN